MAVKDWISDFLGRHRARYLPNDWPAEDAVEENAAFLRGWITAFATRRISEQEAETASCRLTTNPPNYRREHVPMVVQAVEQLRAERNPQAVSGGTREAARDASRGCEYCGGGGLATAYHPWPSDEHRVAATAAAYCVCLHGRWIKRNHAETEPMLLRKFVDLDDVLNGASVYLAEHPEFAGLVFDADDDDGRTP
jgi:hypothetical protein